MDKYIILFEKEHLKQFNIDPTKIVLVIEASDEYNARRQAYDFYGIGVDFLTSHLYNDDHKKYNNIIEIGLYDLEKLRKVK